MPSLVEISPVVLDKKMKYEQFTTTPKRTTTTTTDKALFVLSEDINKTV